MKQACKEVLYFKFLCVKGWFSYTEEHFKLLLQEVVLQYIK